MTTLAEDISALMALGHNLKEATELAKADRARGNASSSSLAMIHHQSNYIPISSFYRLILLRWIHSIRVFFQLWFLLWHLLVSSFSSFCLIHIEVILLYRFIVSLELVDAIVAKLDERDSAKKDVTVLISRATQTKVDSLFRHVGFNILIGDDLNAEDGASFEAFTWNGRSEDDGLPDARTHIENQMRNFGVILGRGGYKIVDVHTNNQLLNVNDEKIGVISGGSDIAVVPFKTANAGIKNAICVLWEVKTEENTSQYADGLRHFQPQALIELLAARCLSEQPGVLVVLTDLVSGALLLKIVYNEEYKGFDVVEYETTLHQMGVMVAQFLSQTSVPDASFRPVEARENPRDFSVITFKKTKLSHDVGLALEHFNDMVDDTEPNSRERAYLVEQLFKSMDIPRMPTMVHHSMYT